VRQIRAIAVYFQAGVHNESGKPVSGRMLRKRKRACGRLCFTGSLFRGAREHSADVALVGDGVGT